MKNLKKRIGTNTPLTPCRCACGICSIEQDAYVLDLIASHLH